MKNSFLTWVVFASYSVSLCGATLPQETLSRMKIGIVRVGELSGPAEKVYPIVEKRVQHWLENLSSDVTSLPRGLTAETVSGSKELSQENDLLWENLSQSGLSGEAERAYNSLKARVDNLKESDRKYGPEWQEALLSLAAYSWMRGDSQKNWEPQITRALLLHPGLEAKLLPDWEESGEVKSPALFQTIVERIRKNIARACIVKLEVEPKDARVFANGFEVGSQGTVLKVNSRATYALSAGAEGYFEKHSSVNCGRGGIRQVKLSLAPKKGSENLAEWTGALDRMARTYDRDGVVVIAPRSQGFKLFYFTPGIDLEEIPLQKEIRVSELSVPAGDGTLPVATDAFVDLVYRHQLTALRVDQVREEADLKISGEVPTSVEWYNNWKFWAVVGGAMAVTSIALFLSRDTNSHVGGTKPSGLTVRFE